MRAAQDAVPFDLPNLSQRNFEQALTFDDVLLVPRYSSFLPRDASLSTHITRRIKLNIPLLSAAMDTVTEARLAICIAQEGGIGIIHKNMPVEEQAMQVRAVKSSKAVSSKIRLPSRPTPVSERFWRLPVPRKSPGCRWSRASRWRVLSRIATCASRRVSTSRCRAS